MAKKRGRIIYSDAHPDEPVFILRASDPSAVSLVRAWAETYQLVKGIENSTGDGPEPLTQDQQRKFDNAMECAQMMERWRELNEDKPPETSNGS